MPRTLLACAALVVALSLSGAAAIAQPVSGTIVGAEAVNVRSGPGTDAQALVAVRRGDTVRVDERSGQWARVTLASGESGYINVAYIAVAAGTTIPTAVDTGAIVPTPTPLHTAEPSAPPLAASTPAIDRELAELRQRLASLEASLEPGGAAPAPTAPSAAAEAVEPPPLPTVVEPPATLDVGPSLALAGVGLLVGFLIGTFYGQRQERNRRTRVRF